jgi:hypothetical protein
MKNLIAESEVTCLLLPGFILLFISNQAIVLVEVPYPPFGLITASFMGLASYLILVGLYYTAISVGEEDYSPSF